MRREGRRVARGPPPWRREARRCTCTTPPSQPEPPSLFHLFVCEPARRSQLLPQPARRSQSDLLPQPARRSRRLRPTNLRRFFWALRPWRRRRPWRSGRSTCTTPPNPHSFFHLALVVPIRFSSRLPPTNLLSQRPALPQPARTQARLPPTNLLSQRPALPQPAPRTQAHPRLREVVPASREVVPASSGWTQPNWCGHRARGHRRGPREVSAARPRRGAGPGV